MAVVVHNASPVVRNSNNFAAYKYEGSCSCGFQTRMATQEAAESQLLNHLKFHNAVPEVKKEVKEEVKTEVKVDTWTPKGK